MHLRILSRACPVFLLTSAGLVTQLRADVLYSNLQGNITGDQTASYTVSNQGTGPHGFGQYYNTGYDTVTLDTFNFYGGISPNSTSMRPFSAGGSLAIYFYDATGTFSGKEIAGNTFAASGSQGNVGTGVGLKSFHNLSSFSAFTIAGSGYVVFVPTAVGYTDLSTGARYAPPTGPCTFTGFFGSAPSVGETDPTVSETGDTFHTVVNSVSSLVAAPAYLQLEMTGTGSGDSSYPSATPLWNASSGTWDNSANWKSGLPNATGATANFVESNTASSTVTLTANETVGIVNFDSPNSYTLSGTGVLTLSNSSGAAVVSSWAGSHIIATPIVYSAGLNVNTPFADPSAAAPDLSLSLAISATGSLTKTGVGTLSFAASTSGITTLNLPSMNITGGAVVLQSNSLHANRTLLTTASLTLASGTMLDLGSNSLDDSGDTLASISSLVGAGFANGASNGLGIASKVAGADSTHLTALGVIQNNQSGTPLYTATHQFEGSTPGVSDVLVKYTYFGDANLDGKVDGSDYSLIDSGYLSLATGWFNGDFNYDGVINGSDYTLIDNAFNTQGAALTASIATPLASSTAEIVTAVPEPASLGLLSLGTMGMLGRRRRV